MEPITMINQKMFHEPTIDTSDSSASSFSICPVLVLCLICHFGDTWALSVGSWKTALCFTQPHYLLPLQVRRDIIVHHFFDYDLQVNAKGISHDW
jgi:hypothetical protein